MTPYQPRQRGKQAVSARAPSYPLPPQTLHAPFIVSTYVSTCHHFTSCHTSNSLKRHRWHYNGYGDRNGNGSGDEGSIVDCGVNVLRHVPQNNQDAVCVWPLQHMEPTSTKDLQKQREASRLPDTINLIFDASNTDGMVHNKAPPIR